jgi:hypothetical protein
MIDRAWHRASASLSPQVHRGLSEVETQFHRGSFAAGLIAARSVERQDIGYLKMDTLLL